MASISIADLRAFANARFEEASRTSTLIKFSAEARTKALNEGSLITNSLIDDDEFADLPAGTGIGAWASILAVDLRGSTRLADSLGPRDTYRMMHTLMPTLAYCLQKMGATNINLRGDGMFSGCCLTKVKSDHDEPEPYQQIIANQQAIAAGLRTIDCVKMAVEPVIRNGDIQASLNVGVGIECGRITVTRIGWKSSQELTAYGSAVNHANHLSGGTNVLRVGRTVWNMIPDSPDGRFRGAFIEDGIEVSSLDSPALIR